ncbi:hypothetical protein [Mastigocladopsis repens]|nr:hypothetical protein [Mastigocladopsis repens]
MKAIASRYLLNIVSSGLIATDFRGGAVRDNPERFNSNSFQ